MRLWVHWLLLISGCSFSLHLSAAEWTRHCDNFLVRILGKDQLEAFGNPTTRLWNEELPQDQSLPEGMGFQFTDDGRIIYEGERILQGPNQNLNEKIKAVESEGGQVLALRTYLSAKTIPSHQLSTYSYFLVNDGKPKLVYGKGASAADIEHEFRHFIEWRDLKRRFIAEGNSPDVAATKAASYLNSKAEIIHRSESLAVRDELQEEPLDIFSREYALRVAYPERAALMRGMDLLKARGKHLSPRSEHDFAVIIDKALEKALRLRELKRQALLRRQADLSLFSPAKFWLKRELKKVMDLTTLPTDVGLLDNPNTNDLVMSRHKRLLKNYVWPDPSTKISVPQP